MWSQKKYRSSVKEREDLGRLYIDYDGDMDRIMQSALCAETEDEPRIREVLQSLIAAQEIPALRAFTHESTQKKRNRRRKVEMEREEAETKQKEMGITSDDSLSALIKRKQKSNQQKFNSLISNLEEKYCEVVPKKKGDK
ncbi:dnaJ homolog subfamily C member 9-like [Clupea harengus]|uniref:DnaJ homolog subfamily C member 9-like n=1 Tax=Clupea harengus TaxID=7950 RepID=A0A8M1KLV4_CLUHA|nr:dnaJ homolog subfamily C member 9-like [Clupea harengus]